MQQDNEAPPSPRLHQRSYRDAWPIAGCPDFISDESLKRLSEARNVSSKNANRLMGFALLFVLIYILRYVDIGQSLSIGGHKLADVPYALFTFLTISLAIMTSAYVRFADSWTFDRQLAFACKKKQAESSHILYASYPNEGAWGQPFGEQVSALKAGGILFLLKVFLQLIFSVSYITVMLSPVIISVHYLYFHIYAIGADFQQFRFWWIVSLSLACFSVFVLMSWTRLGGRREG